jgi:hypothetical protein
MNRAFLLGSLFLRVSTVYAAATHGDIITEGRRRNEEAYERALEKSAKKEDDFHRVESKRAAAARKEILPASDPQNN